MRLHATAEPPGRQLRKGDPVALHDHVDVDVGASEQHVAHEPTHDVGAHALVLRERSYLAQGASHALGQKCVDRLQETPCGLSARLGKSPIEVGVAVLGAQHVLARHDADQERAVHDRDAPDVLAREHALERLEIGVGRRGHDLTRHEALHLRVPEPVTHSTVHVLARHEPADALPVQHGERPVAPPHHELARLTHRGGQGDRAHR